MTQLILLFTALLGSSVFAAPALVGDLGLVATTLFGTSLFLLALLHQQREIVRQIEVVWHGWSMAREQG